MRLFRTMAMMTALSATLGLCATGASAHVEQGNPEAYENGKLVEGKLHPLAVFGGGQLHGESEQLGTEGVSCVILAFGALWNEGSPSRGQGEFLAWYGSGHVAEERHPQILASCWPPPTSGHGGSFVDLERIAENYCGEAPVGAEVTCTHHPGMHHAYPFGYPSEVDKRPGGTLPWYAEARCGVRAEEYVPIIKVGIPASEFPAATSSACPESVGTGEEAEEKARGEEFSDGRGCYVTNPAPTGCVRIWFVEPAAGLEAGWGGTAYFRLENGVHNGLTPTKLVLEGAARSGQLQCEYPLGCSAPLSGRGAVNVSGYSGLGLLQAR